MNYSLAGDDLAKKHEADKIMEDCIKAIPFGQRPWFATPLMLPTQEQQKITQRQVCGIKGLGTKCSRKNNYSHRSSLQTNPIQVRVLRLKERKILSESPLSGGRNPR